MNTPRRKFSGPGFGLAFFALFFPLFLPVSFALAADAGAPNRVLEVCSIDGTRFVAFDENDDSHSDAVHLSEICTLCLAQNGFVSDQSTNTNILSPIGCRFHSSRVRATPYHPKAFVTSDIAARGPPLG